MANTNLTAAKRAKNDEFYTQYHDIEREMNAYLEFNPDVFRGKTVLLPCDDPEWSNFTKYFAQNFKTFGLKKLISTSYALDSKGIPTTTGDQRPFKDPFNAPPQGIDRNFYQTSLFELNSPQFDPAKTNSHGKIFTLTNDDVSGDSKIDINDLQWQYLEFRSDEVKKLRDEADIIITNPPFSLFREFLAWIVEANRQFIIIGSKNAITYKEVFPLIADNKIWVGSSSFSKDMLFIPASEINPSQKPSTAIREIDGKLYLRSPSMWLTNIDHGRRHQPLPLMTMEQNLKFSKHKEIRGKDHYERYDEYNAIDVPFTDSIPNDYNGLMGVPISFLDKYCPEQFLIIGLDRYVEDNPHIGRRFHINGKETYARILIRRKEAT